MVQEIRIQHTQLLAIEDHSGTLQTQLTDLRHGHIPEQTQFIS